MGVFFQPKTVNAFQRVKIDEVEFADEKLQDNSYWAKVFANRCAFFCISNYQIIYLPVFSFLNCLQSGAEIGYGAKAQEVLGQVRGRYACLPA